MSYAPSDGPPLGPDADDPTEAELAALLREAGPIAAAPTPEHIAAVRDRLLAGCVDDATPAAPTPRPKHRVGRWLAAVAPLAAAAAAAVVILLAGQPRSVMAEVRDAVTEAPVILTRGYPVPEAFAVTSELPTMPPMLQIWSHRTGETLMVNGPIETPFMVSEASTVSGIEKTLMIAGPEAKLTITDHFGGGLSSGLDIVSMSDEKLAEFGRTRDVSISEVERTTFDGRPVRTFTFSQDQTQADPPYQSRVTYLIDDETARPLRALLVTTAGDEPTSRLLMVYAYPDSGPRTLADLDLKIDLDAVPVTDLSGGKIGRIVRGREAALKAFDDYVGYALHRPQPGGPVVRIDRIARDGESWRVETSEPLQGTAAWLAAASPKSLAAADWDELIEQHGVSFGPATAGQGIDTQPAGMPEQIGYGPLAIGEPWEADLTNAAEPDQTALMLTDPADASVTQTYNLLDGEHPMTVLRGQSEREGGGTERFARLDKVRETAATPSGIPYPLIVRDVDLGTVEFVLAFENDD